MKKINLNEIEQVFGGMCNCMGMYRYTDSWHTTIEVSINGMGYYGAVTYANVCKDLIANATKSCNQLVSGFSCSITYMGCYDQEDGRNLLPVKQKGE